MTGYPDPTEDRRAHLDAALRLLDGLTDGRVHDEDVIPVADGIRRHLEKAGLT